MRPAVGLLLDVDGPIASPVTRTIAIPSIVEDLVALVAAGVPIGFITGRSDAFLRAEVVAPLREAGLDEALARPGARMFAVAEKGAAWAPITVGGLGALRLDATVAVPESARAAVRALVAERFGQWMFHDETKRAMVSVEQRTDVSSADYLAVQDAFQDTAFDVCVAHGMGLRYRDRERPDAAGLVPFRIEPTIISTDIESVLLDKDRGAERALEYFATLGELPETWRSAGDSRGDYLMADYVHAAGLDVAHLDVRPAEGLLERPYPVHTADGLVHDDAGAALLRHWRERLGA
ncbi:MAG: hypothetical protein QM635_07880 [Microbacteriaceae bacterium]